MQPRAARTESDAAAARAFVSSAEVLSAAGIRLESLLHRGSIADVLRVTLPGGEPAVVKITRERWRHHPGAVELLRREYRVLASLHHPHVVRALSLVERDGRAALVLEDLPGGDLISVAGAPPIHWAQAARDVAAALEAVHASSRMHGDVKAGNVLFSAGGRAKLVDFGSALPFGAPRGRGGRTAAHEPRRFELARAEPAVDVYAFAVLLYQLLTGALPFGRDPDPGEVEALPLRADVPRALADRLMRTLHAGAPGDVGTLMEFVDVLEFLHAPADSAGRSLGRA